MVKTIGTYMLPSKTIVMVLPEDPVRVDLINWDVRITLMFENKTIRFIPFRHPDPTTAQAARSIDIQNIMDSFPLSLGNDPGRFDIVEIPYPAVTTTFTLSENVYGVDLSNWDTDCIIEIGRRCVRATRVRDAAAA